MTHQPVEQKREHQIMDRTKIRTAAAQGVTRLRGLDKHFADARDLADSGDVEGAARRLAPLKDEIMGLLDVLNFAGVRGLTEMPESSR